MANDQDRWSPDTGARLAVIRNSLAKGNANAFELPVQESPAPCFIGADAGGDIWVRIKCDPASVSTDDQAALIVFTTRVDGYKMSLSPKVPESVVCALLDQVMQLLVEGHAPGDAARAAIQNWRELLARPPGSPLGENALVGLLGELAVVEAVLSMGGSLDFWTGWNHDHQDFRLPGLTIEVKSTTSANYRRVQIHGLQQLADPEDGSDLILVLKRFERSQEGRSVPEVIDRIVQLGASRSVLLDRLARVGYHEQHRGHYANTKFVSTEVALRLIDEHHPRLVPPMLKDVDLSSIDKIDYELNLNGDPESDLPQTLDEVIRERLGG